MAKIGRRVQFGVAKQNKNAFLIKKSHDNMLGEGYLIGEKRGEREKNGGAG